MLAFFVLQKVRRNELAKEMVLVPVSVLIDCVCVLLGGIMGATFKDRVHERMKEPLNVIFGICAIGIGVYSFIKLHALPPVILSLVMGAMIGEFLDLDARVKRLFLRIFDRFNFKIHGDHDQYMNFYVVVAVTFCASGTNIFGAMNEGITGDMNILLSKAAMDLFAGAIFASSLGYAMNLIVVPQFLILSSCFYLARFIMHFITAEMFADFLAVGGLLTFALGLSIARIKAINAVNLLPALVIAMPISYFLGFFL